MPTASEDEQAHTRPQRGRPQRPRPFVASERAGARPLQRLTWLSAIRPQSQARNAASGGSAELTGLPVSAVGLTTRLAGEPKGAIRLLTLSGLITKKPGTRLLNTKGFNRFRKQRDNREK
ncbi:hypothetical protein HA51_04150 [Pantoea rwandensis]|uniref:Uncharacterized protein n=1 Tax=Pantoea rwandensis TaxID=1076550 RepID=A0A1X1D363_9GAMM|nr:hypothetical protein HA51_04150 [Pantoea rwandensis]